MQKHRHFHVNGKEISFDEFNALLIQNVQEIAGIQEVTGIEMFNLLHMVTNMSDSLVNLGANDMEVSSARIGILLRLLMDERLGIDEPLTPTALSRFQHVNKNTISSLIRGLEEQGLVTRELDKQDKRVFRLRITEAGKKLVMDNIPSKVQYMNDLASDLTQEERAQMIHLLYKLRTSLVSRLHSSRGNKFHPEDFSEKPRIRHEK